MFSFGGHVHKDVNSREDLASKLEARVLDVGVG